MSLKAPESWSRRAPWALASHLLTGVLALALVALALTKGEVFGWAALVLFFVVAVVREIARNR